MYRGASAMIENANVALVPLIEFFSALLSTVTYFTLTQVCLSVGCLLLFHNLELSFDMNTQLIGLAIVFPIVFSIGSAYSRRETSITLISNMKGTAHSMRLMFHHYSAPNEGLCDGKKEIDNILTSLFTHIAEHFTSETHFTRQDYKRILDHFSAVSWLIEIYLTRGGMPPPQVARIQECLR